MVRIYNSKLFTKQITKINPETTRNNNLSKIKLREEIDNKISLNEIKRDKFTYKKKIERYKKIYLNLSPKNHRNDLGLINETKLTLSKIEPESHSINQLRKVLGTGKNVESKGEIIPLKQITRIRSKNRYSHQNIMDILKNCESINEINKLLERFNSLSNYKILKKKKVVKFKF